MVILKTSSDISRCRVEERRFESMSVCIAIINSKKVLTKKPHARSCERVTVGCSAYEKLKLFFVDKMIFLVR